MTDFRFKQVEIFSYMKFSQEAPMVFDFTEAHSSGQNITILRGDQELGKTCTLNALLFAVGKEMDLNLAQMTNRDDGRLKINASFTVDGLEYRIEARGDTFRVQRFIAAPENAWSKVGPGKTTLKKLIRAVSSPLFLQDMNGSDQLKWFRDNFSNDPDIKAKDEKLMEQLTRASNTRTDAWREYDRLKKALSTDELYLNREKSAERFKTPITIDAVKSNLETAAKGKLRYDSAVEKLVTYRQQEMRHQERISDIDRQIAELTERKAKEAIELATVKNAIAAGEQFLKNNIDLVKNHEAADREFTNLSNALLEQQRWTRLLEQEKEMEEYETLMQKAEGHKDDALRALLALTREYIPAIEGLEVKVADLEDKSQGVFFNGLSLAQLSESEWWGLFLRICLHCGVCFVIVENISSLGSKAAEIINMLAEQGVKFFASEMDRTLPELSLEFTGKLE